VAVSTPIENDGHGNLLVSKFNAPNLKGRRLNTDLQIKTGQTNQKQVMFF
jgi:hypothetical protein